MWAALLSFRFILWFIVGAAVSGFILYRRGREPLVGAVISGLIGSIGGIVPLLIVWLWMWYVLRPGEVTVIRARRNRWRIRW